MDINEIKKLIKVFESAKVTELSIQEGDLKIKISKNGNSSNTGYIQQNIPLELPNVGNQISSSEPVKVAPVEDNSHI
ncbi:MAG: hypothetical protein OQJ81_06910, partial [Melioribacteraceae bacterium]|nr:hypothetical protein [Melioribacteraceae bacterium]